VNALLVDDVKGSVLERFERVRNARLYAELAHGEQRYGAAPYVVHLDAVVSTLVQLGQSEDEGLLVAGYLHDVLEDTDARVEELDARFGSEVAYLVYAVTDEPGRNRRERKVLTYPKTRRSARAVLLKLADRIANVRAAVEQENERLLAIYRVELPLMRQMLWHEGEWEEAWQMLDTAPG
jgi:(p)ppGpp synthase/HD superfamily hydrolase